MEVSATQTSSLNETMVSDDILGKEDFLKLLVAQMQHQDPLEPMSNEEFVLQLSQLSTMEQLQNLTGSMDAMSDLSMLGNAAGLIGKDVTFTNPETLETVSGTVSELEVSNGNHVLIVGEYSVPVGSVIAVREPTVPSVVQ